MIDGETRIGVEEMTTAAGSEDSATGRAEATAKDSSVPITSILSRNPSGTNGRAMLRTSVVGMGKLDRVLAEG